MSRVDLAEAPPGTELGVSAWRTIDQARIDRFAEATDDRQFIHVDPVRAAAEGPFGGTVAHGFLVLSLVTTFAGDVLVLPPGCVAVNFAVDGVRFLSPVRTGSRVRARFTLSARTGLGPQRWAAKLAVALEVEGESRPAVTIATLTVLVAPATSAASA